MKYINIKTGAVIETACVIKGDDWKVVEEQPRETTKKTGIRGTKKKSGE